MEFLTNVVILIVLGIILIVGTGIVYTLYLEYKKRKQNQSKTEDVAKKPEDMEKIREFDKSIETLVKEKKVPEGNMEYRRLKKAMYEQVNVDLEKIKKPTLKTKEID